jgi:hypothetical protein
LKNELAAWPLPIVDRWYSAFMIAVAFVSYSEIKAQFDATALTRWLEANDALLVPQLCGEARGVAGTDYSTENSIPLRENGKPNYFATCWYAISKFRPLYPEYNNLSDEELSRKLYADHGVPTRVGIFRRCFWALGKIEHTDFQPPSYKR